VVGIGRRRQFHRLPAGKVHQDFVSLGRSDHQVSQLYGLRQKSGIPGNHEERPAIGEA